MLIKARESRFLTQEDVSKITGLDVTTISRLELGKVQPRSKTIQKLSEALDVPPDSFYVKDDVDLETSHFLIHSTSNPESMSIKMEIDKETYDAALRKAQENGTSVDVELLSFIIKGMEEGIPQTKQEAGEEVAASFEKRLKVLEEELAALRAPEQQKDK